MNILFIEDDDEKATRIFESITADFPGVGVLRARSFNSGLRALVADASSFSLVLLDMTMPSYDPTPNDSGSGSVEHFAGRDLLAQMELRHIRVPTVVLTMFDSFGQEPKKVSLGTLIEELENKYAPNFVGHVYYNATEDGWRVALRDKISVHARRD